MNQLLTTVTRTIFAGIHTFDVFAKPTDSNQSDLFKVFTYVINVDQGNLKWEAYPQTYSGWGIECETTLREGKLDEGENREVEVKAPDALDVAFITADGEWAHLEKVNCSRILFVYKCEYYQL